ncbi:hypothetical protein BP5796_05898 [Coleophoma crateriformis]|uniref:Calpain catalytic domain-containing protein n=1 Tax=Coleophoma crateriformis TaxID=565419 RepID=A0A3D8RVP0_9HELO|nr:hypothetical protein BP5796_05898 [Coleophoma crateriformis]
MALITPTTASTIQHSSQEIINDFWKANLTPAAAATKPPTVLPSNIYAQLVGKQTPKGDISGQCVTDSYEEAVKECIAKVAAIVKECRRNNLKYTDPHFDLDDFQYCLTPLSAEDTAASTPEKTGDNVITYDVTQKATSTGAPIFWGNIQPASTDAAAAPASQPACAKRVGDIFEKPQFFIQKDAHIKDIRQGAEGDCWFISSLGCLCTDEKFPHLIEKICPQEARDEKVGVYGFVFYRDGTWVSEVIDDKLYLSAPDYDDCDDSRRSVWDRSHSRLDPEVSREEYRKTFQTGSDALFFGSCADQNETWVPLIEKAFAKTHGDYEAIDGGWPGEGVEDLTGGVTTEMVSADILDKDQLWNEVFLQVNKEFLVSAGTREYGHPDPNELGRQGIEDGHAYSLLQTVEYAGQRLCMVKNPWGETEWNGPWSDGAKQWTPEALTTLNHKFGNEGIFWMPFEDFLRRYVQIWRTRLFTPEWQVTQRWTTLQVPWSGDYNDTKFEFVLSKPSTTVIVLSQLDTRYFGGLTGQYAFQLAFRLHKSGEKVHIVRGYSSGDRSATTEVDLEAGTYEVLLQISGQRDSTLPKVEDVVQHNWLSRRDKLMRIGLSYDLANAKGQIDEASSAVKATTRSGVTTTVMEPVAPTAQSIAPVNAAPSANYGTDVATETAPNDVAATPASAPLTTVEPWNASCVVGLRVFSIESAATIRVVKPTVAVMGISMTKLDVDDPEKDATDKAISMT